MGNQFKYAIKNFMAILSQIFTEDDQKVEDYRMSNLGGFGELPVSDGVVLDQMDAKRGFITKVTAQVRAGVATMTQHDADTNLLYNIRRIGNECADACNATVQLLMLRLFGRAFNGSYLGGDGKAWAATDHPAASKADENGASVADDSAGSYSNLIHDELSVEAISRTAWGKARRFKTPAGLPLAVDFDNRGILLVAPEQAGEAAQICGKDGRLIPEKLPGSAENDANPTYGLKYLVVGGGDEGFADGEWAVADRFLLKQSLIMNYIRRPECREANIDNPYVLGMAPYVDCAAGFGDPRAIIFSDSSGAENA